MCKILLACLNQGSLKAIHSRHPELSARQWESWIILANPVRRLAPLEGRVSAMPSKGQWLFIFSKVLQRDPWTWKWWAWNLLHDLDTKHVTSKIEVFQEVKEMKIGTDIVTKPAHICPTSPSLTSFLSNPPLLFEGVPGIASTISKHPTTVIIVSRVSITYSFCTNDTLQPLTSISPRPPALGGIHFYPMLALVLHLLTSNTKVRSCGIYFFLPYFT